MESPIQEEEEETDWRSREDAYPPPADPFCRKGTKAASSSNRVIMHLDMDCFYAQVEMIRNPELRGKPLGVQQKSLLVTCNYEARRLGVGKCMTVREAKEKLPQMVLVSGEDLTHYREISYKVTELLEEFSAKVERLGFDENFIDLTELVDKKLEEQQDDGSLEVAGHVYCNQTVHGGDGTHRRLVAGSRVAADIRAAVHGRLGLTGCAGIASNKLLAKLVSGTFKPNQQTVLFPESSSQLINSLVHASKIPGIGHKTAQRLEGLGLRTVYELQVCPISVLEKELGASVAHRIQELSRGEDASPVTPTGAPQSISEEDSFRKCSSVSEVRLKLEELLSPLLSRLYADGRSPHTLRLSLRQSSASNKYWNRESRQCPVPKNLILNRGSEHAVPALMEMLMKLFEKMIDVKSPFHLTLLNVCFSNLKAAQSSNTSRCSIGFYLTQKKAPSLETSQKEDGTREEKEFKGKSPSDSKRPTIVQTDHAASLSLPDDIDMDVFSQLPEDIRKEILSSPQTGRINKTNQTNRPSPAAKSIQNFFVKAKTKDLQMSGDNPVPQTSGQGLPNNIELPNILPLTKPEPPGTSKNTGRSNGTVDQSWVSFSSCLSSSSGISETMVDSQCCYTDSNTAMDCAHLAHSNTNASFFPTNVDMNIFSQLPQELQKELMTDWKNKNLTPKVPIKKSNEKLKSSKGQRPSSSTNSKNLLNYFKPG